MMLWNEYLYSNLLTEEFGLYHDLKKEKNWSHSRLQHWRPTNCWPSLTFISQFFIVSKRVVQDPVIERLMQCGGEKVIEWKKLWLERRGVGNWRGGWGWGRVSKPASQELQACEVASEPTFTFICSQLRLEFLLIFCQAVQDLIHLFFNVLNVSLNVLETIFCWTKRL